ncbi:MAG TPA: hypothetical protein VIX73_04935 [Kofleriaceae bacterium]
MKIVFAALFSVSLLGACAVQSVPPSSSEGPSSSMEVTSFVVQHEDSSCACDIYNCDYTTCSCSDACSNGDACTECCKGSCNACGADCKGLPKVQD